jgi:hypothetical protein
MTATLVLEKSRLCENFTLASPPTLPHDAEAEAESLRLSESVF